MYNMTATPSPPCLPHVMTRGTFYDVGYSTGVTFQKQIQLFFNESYICQTFLLPFYDSRAGRDFYEESLRVCQDCFPHYVREVKGTADGASLQFEHAFMNNVFEYKLAKHMIEQGSKRATSGERPKIVDFGCTDLFVHTDQCQVLAHNEDQDPLVKTYGYLISAAIEEDGHHEQFTAFAPPASLPGRCFGYNGHGLVNSNNSLPPAEMTMPAPGRCFLLRALLAAHDVDQAVTLMKNRPFGSASGFAANLCTPEGRMTSVEVGPGKPESLVHVHDVTQQSGYYYHLNSYKHLKVSQIENPSSTARQKRCEELPAPDSLQAALAVMADDLDPLYPIFRTPRPSDFSETVCTVVFDVTARQMAFYQGRQSLLEGTPLYKFLTNKY